MDAASLQVKLFLETLQESWTALADISNRWRKWVPIAKPSVSSPSGRPFTLWNGATSRVFNGCVVLGIYIQVQPLVDRSIEFEIMILWDDEQWCIRTDVGESSEEAGYKLIRTFPEQRASSLAECIQHIQTAIKDLAGCDDIVLGMVRGNV